MTEADTPRGRGRGPRRGAEGGAPAGAEGGGGGEGEGRRGFGRDRRGRGDRRRRGGRGGKDGESAWTPMTRLGRLVNAGLIARIEELYLYAMPVKEYQIIDHFLGSKLKDEVIRISPVQKQTTAGQRTRFQAYVLVGDNDGHIGLGVKCSKEVANAIKGAMVLAKLSVVPVRRGYWGTKIGMPHTVVAKVTGKCGTAAIRFIPAPRGTGLVASIVPKKVLVAAGIEDVFSSSWGSTRTTGNFVKATFLALAKTYTMLTPDLWPVSGVNLKSPLRQHAEFLVSSGKRR